MIFSFKKGSWHDLNPGKIPETKEIITEPDEVDNHIDISTPTDDQLSEDVSGQYEHY